VALLPSPERCSRFGGSSEEVQRLFTQNLVGVSMHLCQGHEAVAVDARAAYERSYRSPGVVLNRLFSYRVSALASCTAPHRSASNASVFGRTRQPHSRTLCE
jgi:hypothetical protein